MTLTTSLGEDSSLIKANGCYFSFVSPGHCCDGLKSTYEVVYGRSSKVTGPYVNRKGEGVNANYEKLLAGGQDGNSGQGGQSFFVRPVYFDNDGWPTFDVRCKAKGYTKELRGRSSVV